ncbi:adenylate kinase [Schumannella luteola]|uniref:Adenylate kinase n=1 Tax=Schumannella luteola TaxID=472059 RepID=A0A852YCD3_9MICO|nr:adenylate kinase [Schumannella luteola]NYH00637.1 adenylate kinase [Schumannella luteola]TPX04909.1 adenylate kinase [Schumannella luteola]
MTRLLIVGPPGVGKGTQAERIVTAYGIPTISTGDIFRANIKNETELGLRVKAIVDAGDYVPDELTNELVTDRLSEADAGQGFLLDGYPRTTQQVAYLDELLSSHGHELDAVVRLVADRDEIVTRLRKRAVEQGRLDDSEEAIAHRQDVYARETEPLIAAYRDRGLLVEVDGLGTVDEVTQRVFTALASRGIDRVSA